MRKIIQVKEIILCQFEQDIASKLLEFMETLSKSESDIFVFMSRKFCCLYDMLVSIGAPPVQKPIVSDKALDLSTDFFRNKIVTIVDDIIICGTTVWKAKNRLLSDLGAKKVNTFVFCVNDKYWVPELIEPDYKAAVLSDNRSLTFCTSIVSSLSILPRPYSIEFPYISDLTIKNRYWHKIISSNDWNVYDITTKVQEENDISTYTFFPSFIINEKLKETFGEIFFDTIDICKVRIYAKKLSWGMYVSILPLVTFNPFSNAILNNILNHFFSFLKKDKQISEYEYLFSQFSNPESQLRLLQYSASLILFSKLKSDINKVLGKNARYELRNIDIELLFGVWNVPLVNRIYKILMDSQYELMFEGIECSSKNLDIEHTEIKELMKKGTEVEPESIPYDIFPEDDHRNILADFSNIFLSLYFKKELPSREAVRSAAERGDFEKIKNIDRLETGITWHGILEYLKSIFKYQLTNDIKNVLSLVLDYSVDRGICVPILRFDKDRDVVYRAFRHGEDVKFAEEETELCGFAIEKAQEIIGNNQITKLFLEKLLVLFIKIGASRKVFQIQYGTNGQEGIAKIGFHLMGAVVKLKRKNSYNVESDLWLSKHLLEKNVIKYSGNGMYSFNRHYPAIQVVSSSKTESKKFGLTLGLLYKGIQLNEIKYRLNDDDLIYLSTCFRPRDVAAALYVEIDLYFEELAPIVLNLFENLNNIFQDKANSIKNLIQNKGYAALNQLHKKTIGWLSSGARIAIEKGNIILTELNQQSSLLDWESYWSSFEIYKREDEEKMFSEYIFKISKIGHRLLFYINLIEITLNYNKENESISSLIQSCSKMTNFYDRTCKLQSNLLDETEHSLYNNLKNIIETKFKDFDDIRTITFINKKIKELNYEASKLTPLINNALEDFEQRGVDTINYDYVIYYDIVDSTATKKMSSYKEIESYRNKIKRVKYSINNFIEILQKDAFKSQDEIYCWNGDTSSTNDAKFIFLSSKREGFSLRRIKEFIDRLYNLSDNDISFRTIICPTNAFYSRVFRRFQKNEVEGEQFWEHYSRIHKYFKKLEEKHSTMNNLVLLVGNETTPIPSDSINLDQKVWQGEIETVIAAGYFKTKGELWIPKKQNNI